MENFDDLFADRPTSLWFDFVFDEHKWKTNYE